jgi:tRNA threonylcarbamoyladenosine biosynthesis protein TsaE
MNAAIHLNFPTLQETVQFGQRLGRSLPPGSILLLHGDLGSGKTTLVKAIGKGLGIADEIVSPTFVLVNEYHSGRIPLYHFDLYRLEPSQVPPLAIEHYWDEAEYEPGIVAVEWADRLGDRLPYAMQIHLNMPLEQPSPLVASESPLGQSASFPPQPSSMESSSEGRTATLTLEGDCPDSVQLFWTHLASLYSS